MLFGERGSVVYSFCSIKNNKNRKEIIVLKKKKNKKYKGRYKKKTNISNNVEDRRNMRTSSIIAILAIIITAFTILFQLTKRMGSVWSANGITYITVFCFFVISLIEIIIIICDIVKFLVTDLNRYNIEDKGYCSYDEKSDYRYALLIFDFKIMIRIIVFQIVIIAISNLISSSFILKVIVIIIAIVFIIIVIIWVVSGKIHKAINWSKFKRVLLHLMWIFIVSIYVFVLTYHRSAKVMVTFDSKGAVVVENEGNTEFEKVSIIIRAQDNKIEDFKNVSCNDILEGNKEVMMERENTNQSVVENQLTTIDKNVYWKYQYVINKKKLIEGKYYIIIKIIHNNRTVEISNMFEIKDKKIVFCRNKITQKY